MSCSPVLDISPGRDAGWNIAYSSCSFTNTYIKLSNQTPSLLHSNWLNNPPKNQSHSTSPVVCSTGNGCHTTQPPWICPMSSPCQLRISQMGRSVEEILWCCLFNWSSTLLVLPNKRMFHPKTTGVFQLQHTMTSRSSLKNHLYSIELINQTFEQTFKNPWNLSENPWKSYVPLTCSS